MCSRGVLQRPGNMVLVTQSAPCGMKRSGRLASRCVRSVISSLGSYHPPPRARAIAALGSNARRRALTALLNLVARHQRNLQLVLLEFRGRRARNASREEGTRNRKRKGKGRGIGRGEGRGGRRGIGRMMMRRRRRMRKTRIGRVGRFGGSESKGEGWREGGREMVNEVWRLHEHEQRCWMM